MKNKKILKKLLCICLLVFLTGSSLVLSPDKPAPMPKPTATTQPATTSPSAATDQTSKTSTNSGQTDQPPSSLAKPAKQDDHSTPISSIVLTSRPEDLLSYAHQHQLDIEKTINYGGLTAFVMSTTTDSSALASLKNALPDVQLTPNYHYHPALTPTDPGFSSQWNLAKVQMPQAWDYSTGSSSVTLAIIDSGILSDQTLNGTHFVVTDLPTSRIKLNSGEQGMTTSGGACWTGTPQDKSTNNCDDDGNGYVDDYKGWDFMGGFRGSTSCPNHNDPTTYETTDHTYLRADNEPQPYSCDSATQPTVLNKDDYNGDCTVSACALSHGTMVASVAAASMNNGSIVGVNPNVKLLNLRIFDGYGNTTSAATAEAILYAKNNGAQVINLSLAYSLCNGSFTDPTVEAAITSAKTAGLTIVAASGNSGSANTCYPSSSPQVIAVGSTNSSDDRSSFSSYGSQLDMTAPGENVPADFAPSAAYGNAASGLVSGTSFAAPTVAGMAAMIKGIQPGASPDTIKDIMTLRSDIVAGMGNQPWTNQYGYGRLNAYISVRVALGQLPVYKFLQSSLPDTVLTNNITERNTLMASKLAYQGIDFWDTGSNYAGNLSDYRKYIATH